jgi:uncharacterized protein YdeI (BOF family)
MMNRMTTGALGLAVATALAASPALAQNPYAQPDDSWISIDGEVTTVSSDSFLLDYGDGVITVEMDDGDFDADGYKLDTGEMVTVSGVVDDDFLETATIEASSVYVEDAGTYYFASAVDEEDAYVTVTAPVDPSRTTIQGTVTEVRDEEFDMMVGTMELTVEVEEMMYNPLDDEGFHTVESGDVVSVTGEMDADLFEGTELVASSVVTVVDWRTSTQ